METLGGQWEKENNIQQSPEKNVVMKDPHQLEIFEEDSHDERDARQVTTFSNRDCQIQMHQTKYHLNTI
jgi:hypothetical protein